MPKAMVKKINRMFEESSVRSASMCAVLKIKFGTYMSLFVFLRIIVHK